MKLTSPSKHFVLVIALLVVGLLPIVPSEAVAGGSVVNGIQIPQHIGGYEVLLVATAADSPCVTKYSSA